MNQLPFFYSTSEDLKQMVSRQQFSLCLDTKKPIEMLPTERPLHLIDIRGIQGHDKDAYALGMKEMETLFNSKDARILHLTT
jgi:hypothetical protein